MVHGQCQCGWFGTMNDSDETVLSIATATDEAKSPTTRCINMFVPILRSDGYPGNSTKGRKEQGENTCICENGAK